MSKNNKYYVGSERSGLIEASNTKSDFSLFLDQQAHFIEALREHDPSVWFPTLRGNFEADVPGNWFICFVPAAWGYWKGNYGIHFGFLYGREKSLLSKRIRLAIGVESPLKEQYKQDFKEEVIYRVNAKEINLEGFTLIARNRKKLLEADPIPFNSGSWRIALDKYISLHPIVDIIGEVSREFCDRGAFDTIIQF